MESLVNAIRNFYGRWERPISSLSLVGGFVFDIFALRRIDTFWENLWIVGHILIVGIFIVLVNLKKHKEGDEEDPTKANFWYVNIVQFFFGGLLSTYLVFYFRSADLATSWFFVLILALAFWANESLKRQYVRLSFQISLFFLSLYSFAIFLLPIIFHSISSWVFVLAGAISLLLISVFTHIIIFFNKEKFHKSKRLVSFSIGGILVLMNILYFTNIIPPIPLSLKDAGVFHLIQKNDIGDYLVSYEDRGWRRYLTLYEDIHVSPGMPVYVYSAVFVPASLNINIVHRWQRFDESADGWVDQDLINLFLVGGREGGYRTYSMKSDLLSGRWRVNIETPRGQVLGRVRFDVINTNEVVLLSSRVL